MDSTSLRATMWGSVNATNDKRRELVNQVSPSFCLAKWLQCTVDLHNGLTQSCHHPTKHKIPLLELQSDLGALHNTQFKIHQRMLMLGGHRPPECKYCWSVEDLPGDHVSDRIIKSLDPWAFPHLQEIVDNPLARDIVPTYLEVMLDNKCNLSCVYCMASVSSSIQNEIEQYGPYPVQHFQHRAAYQENVSDEYINAFWQWLPLIIKKLKVLRITGGEPIISDRFLRMLDFLEKESNPDLELYINSNLSVSGARFDRIIKKIEEILCRESIKMVEFYVSVESVGRQAEYIRTGLHFESFDKNIRKILSTFKNEKVVIMSTFNSLCSEALNHFGNYVVELKKEYGGNRVILDCSYLEAPSYLSIHVLPQSLQLPFKRFYDFLLENQGPQNEIFSEYEINKYKRIVDLGGRSIPKRELQSLRKDFSSFILEYDRRKGLSFSSCFPTLTLFLSECALQDIP